MKRGTAWPIAVATILAITVGANLWVMWVAGHDPSFAVEKDYYRKAVDWDSVMAQERRNQVLGWRLAPVLAPFTATEGARLTVRLADAHGAPITGAAVHVAALFNGRAADIYEATLAPVGDSSYAGRLPVHHRGAWELRFEARRGPDLFTAIARVAAVPDTAARTVARRGSP